jgi:hypothetical protein
LRNKLEDFYLAWAEWLDEELGRRPRRYVFSLLLLSFTCSQHLPEIVRHPPLSGGLGQEVRHRPPFVDKETDEAARLGQRQRVTEQVHRLVLVTMRLQSDRLEHHHLEPFILPPPGFHSSRRGRLTTFGRGRGIYSFVAKIGVGMI